MSNIELIKILPSTVKQQTELTRRFIDLATSGEVNPIEVELYLKALEAVVDNVRKDIDYRFAVNSEADKYNEKKFSVGSATVEKSQKTTYDYSNDPIWAGLKSKLSEREKMLKALPGEMADPETGEIAVPPSKKVSEFLKVSFEK